MANLKTTLPQGSLVLVTSATGYVASHVVKQFLERGYRVRGTVRDLAKASWLTEGVFKPYAETGYLSLTVVPDLGADHAFDDSVKGVSAIVHMATIASFDPDPNKVVPQTVAGITSLLNAAMKEPTVREFVYTGSIVTSTMVIPGLSTHVEHDTWNDLAVQLAWAPPPYEPSRGFIVYMASKVAAEKEFWAVTERQPHFTVNVISPATIFGPPLNQKHLVKKSAFVTALWNGDTDELSQIPATYVIDVQDVALLHVAAILDPDVRGGRLQAWGWPCNWNDILAILREIRPDRKFVSDFPNSQQLSLTTDHGPALALLKKWCQQDGWRSLKHTIADSLIGLE